MRHNADTLRCKDDICAATAANIAECCDAQNECPTYKCPEHMVHKNHSENTRCQHDPCTDADRYICCDLRQTCENFPCEAYGYADSKGIMFYCAGMHCDDPDDGERCCIAGAGNSQANQSSNNT